MAFSPRSNPRTARSTQSYTGDGNGGRNGGDDDGDCGGGDDDDDSGDGSDHSDVDDGIQSTMSNPQADINDQKSSRVKLSKSGVRKYKKKELRSWRAEGGTHTIRALEGRYGAEQC